MKNRYLILFLTLVMSLLTVTSCSLPFGPKDPPTKEPENLIYNESSELYFIYDPSISSDYLGQIITEIDYARGSVSQTAAVDSEPHKHEIVFGRTDREISKTAYSRLERVEKNSPDQLVFLIYSDGSSLAVVWEECEDDKEAMDEIALEYFYENYCLEELTAKSGVVYSRALDIVEDYYRVIDDASRASAWNSFAEKYGEKLATSFKQLYAIYSPDSIEWLANLYDPDICVCVDLYGEAECSGTKYCGTGGFYYSNSARDTMGYLPDAESTSQALNFLTSAGLAWDYNDVITEDMKKQIGDFIYALEEPNGYFYHPQWGIEFTDNKVSRRARDLTWCCGILSNLGRIPKYTTASGMKGEDVLGTSSHVTVKLGSGIKAVSKVIAASEDAYAPHLQDLESFIEYLDSKDLRNSSYGVGNELTAQTSQIKERDRQIGTAENPTPLMSYLIEWLNEGQNPETGHWDWKKPGDEGYLDYHGTNGLLKISGIYSVHGVTMPYAREAALSAMADIINPAPIAAVVDIYNTWFAIKNIINNLNECGDDADKAEAIAIRNELREKAPEAILVSRDKISAFLKSDGSASYLKNQSSPTSQGCPAAVPGTNEGDVNGATIAINGLIGNIASALGVSKPALFGKAERYLFRSTIANLSPIKKVDDAQIPEPFTFDDDKVGSEPEDITVLPGSSGNIKVIADPTGVGEVNVLEINSSNKAGDTVKIYKQNDSGLAKSYVFEGDFYIDEAQSDYLLQLTLDACYMVTFRQVTDESDPDYGRIRLVESSSGTGNVSIDRYLGVTVDKGQWFRLKIEYYYGDESTVRIKFYADTDLSDESGYKLYAVSDNYRDESGVKVSSGSSTPSKNFYVSQIYVMRSAAVNLYMDNLNCYVSKDAYSALLGKEDSPYFNIDTLGDPEVVYNFDDGNIPSDFKVESLDTAVGVTDEKMLSIVGSANPSRVTSPITVREAAAKCAAVEFDVIVNSAKSGKEALLIEGMDGKERIFGLALIGAEDSLGSYLLLSPKSNTSTDPAVEGVRIPIGEKITLRFEYFHLEDVIIVYVDGEFVGAVTKLYDEGNRRIMDSLRLSTAENSTASLLIDDLTVEMTAKLLTEAVTPKIPEKTYTFDEVDSDTVLSDGATIQKHNKDKVVAIGSGKLVVPINVRAKVINSVHFSAEFDYGTLASGDGDLHRISLKDAEGNVILSYILAKYDEEIGLFEVGRAGKLSHPLYTFPINEAFTLAFSAFTGQEMVHITSGKNVVAKSSVFAGIEFASSGFASVTVENLGAKATLMVDDLRCEALYSVYKVAKVKEGTVNPETDLSTGISFDKSSSGSLPSLIHVLNYGDNYVGVKNVYNDIAGEYSNALVLGKPGAGNDELGFVSDNDLSTAKAVVFETDIKLDVTSAGCAYRIYFGQNKKGADSMYMLQINRNSLNEIYLEDVSSAADNSLKNKYLTDARGGEWFRLRVELYDGTNDTVRFKVYINGELIGESDNYVGKHLANGEVGDLPKAVSFYCMGATRGDMYLDNVSLYVIE